MDTEKTDFYQNMRASIHKWAKSDGKDNKFVEYILLLPDFFYLLCKLMLDGRISTTSKAKIGLVLAYIVSPIDLIPEAFVGPVGFIDDVVIAVIALNSLINEGDKEIVKENWPGDKDVLKVIEDVLKIADEMIGMIRLKKIKDLLTPKEDK